MIHTRAREVTVASVLPDKRKKAVVRVVRVHARPPVVGDAINALSRPAHAPACAGVRLKGGRSAGLKWCGDQRPIPSRALRDSASPGVGRGVRGAARRPEDESLDVVCFPTARGAWTQHHRQALWLVRGGRSAGVSCAPGSWLATAQLLHHAARSREPQCRRDFRTCRCNEATVLPDVVCRGVAGRSALPSVSGAVLRWGRRSADSRPAANDTGSRCDSQMLRQRFQPVLRRPAAIPLIDS